MPSGDGRQHALLEMDGAIGHAATQAGRAEPPAFAREGDELRVAAAAALEVKAAVLHGPRASLTRVSNALGSTPPSTRVSPSSYRVRCSFSSNRPRASHPACEAPE